MIAKNRLTIIAEVGSVHDGSIGNALRLIDAAADCGAHVVKFQTHIPGAESLVDAPSPGYFIDEPRFEYFQRTSFSLAQWMRISKHCEDVGVGFLSSPFSLEAVDLLETVNVSLYKIPSGEVTNSPLLERISKTGKPIYLSSGMSNWSELDQAVSILKSGGPLTIMQCTSAYPCAPTSVGLNVISEMRNRYGLDVGFSDHTLGFAASIGAVVLGANVVEKHFTFSKLMYGSDAKHSMEPVEFKRFCHEISEAFIMREGNIDKNDLSTFEAMKEIFEKSIVLSRPMEKGTILSFKDLAFKKPGNGIKAARYLDVIGRKICKDLPIDKKLDWEDLI